MALAKMQRSNLAKAVAGEGWDWIDYQLSSDHNERKRFGEIQRAHQESDRAQAKQLAGLTKKRDEAQAKVHELLQADGKDETQLAKLRASLESWEGQLVEIRAALYAYHPVHHGDLRVTRGLIRQEDRQTVAAQIRSAAACVTTMSWRPGIWAGLPG